MRYTEEVERSLLTLVITSAIKTLVGIQAIFNRVHVRVTEGRSFYARLGNGVAVLEARVQDIQEIVRDNGVKKQGRQTNMTVS